MKRMTIHAIMLAVLLAALLSLGWGAAGAQEPEPPDEAVSGITTIYFDNMERLSPDGNWLAYVTASDLGMSESKIWISIADGADKHVLVSGGDNFWVTNPIWSPGGEMLAYLKIVNMLGPSYAVDSEPEMWVVYLDSGASRQVLDSTNFYPALGYGGQADVSWVSNSVIEYLDQGVFPATRHQVDIHTGGLTTKVDKTASQLLRILAQPSNVTCVWEHNTAWACDYLGHSTWCTIGSCPSKPGTRSCGCTLTSVTMILKYFGVDTDPGRLNQWLKDNNGFSGANMVLSAVVGVDDNVYSYQPVGSNDVSRLKSELDAGYPVLLDLDGHWVVATGYSGNTIYYNDPSFDPCDGRTLDASGDAIKGLGIYHGTLPPPPSDTTPPTISFTSYPATGQWYNTNRTLSWTVSDPESGVDYFRWEWDDSSPDTRVDSDHGSTKLSVAGQGKHTLYVRAWNNDGKASSVESIGWFGYDTIKPNNPIINPGCSAFSNQWQNTCRDPSFTWSAADQNGSKGSGVADYAYAWGTASSADPSNWSSTMSYDPGPIADADGWSQYYLHVKARDIAGNRSSLATFGFWYDGTVPTVTFSINNDASTTNQTTVHLNLSAGDTGSGVSEVCVSNNSDTCTNWQPYADTLSWTLPVLDRRTLSVYVRVRDRAGNESAVASDDIYLDLYPPAPHSANYRICASVVDAAGQPGITSTNYSLVSAVGQPWATGAAANASAGFSERTGFLADVAGCLPISYPVTSNFTVTQWVIASGGNLRGNATYRLGDTVGQAAASRTNAFTSTSYVLSSGFWAQITGTVPPTPTVPTPHPTLTPTVTPTPGPTPTPQPGRFGVSINGGALFTDAPAVTVHTWAPNVTHMRLSNGGGYADDDWRTYQVTSTWVLSTTSDYVIPRYVYAWFRDAGSDVYGPYFDDIIYDPVAPEGSVSVLGGEAVTVTLWLEAWDDNSGVDQMRVSEEAGGQGTAWLPYGGIPWQPYTNTITWVLQSGVVYAQFQDRAGNESFVYGSDGSVYNPNAEYSYVYLPLVLRGQ
jgi:hypothetical protein